MGFTTRVMDASATTLYATNGYSGSDTDVAGTQLYTDAIDLTQSLGASFDITFDGDNATDDLLFRVYKRIADSTFESTEIAFWSTTIDSDGTEDIYVFDIPESWGPGYYRFGMIRSGSATTFDVEIKYRKFKRTDMVM